MAKVKSKGVLLEYSDDDLTYVALTQKTDVSFDFGQWDRAETTDHDTSGSTKEYDTTLKEPVSIDVSGFLDPAETSHAWLISTHAAGTSKFFRLTLKDAGAATLALQGHLTALSIGGLAPSGHHTFSATISGTTAATFTA